MLLQESDAVSPCPDVRRVGEVLAGGRLYSCVRVRSTHACLHALLSA